ncbi:hypothetical protein PBY51_014356 [Eleginops maclovinus]|uniref:Uncharacterized protein n=1 Tax=Eleginops maclovinus TaxID=56733 RepID=A0AAN7WXA0_ELEMC|nr:hypothetical protein PBY51_014356 [Eleginops maclovinus]
MHRPVPSYYGYWGRGVSSYPGSSSHLPGLPIPRSNKAPELPAPQEARSSAGHGSYRARDFNSSPNMAVGKADYANLRNERYNSPEVSDPEVAYAGNGYDSSAQVVGYGNSASTEERVGLNSEPAGEEEPEPVFSDVSGLEPVYSFSSRSRYQRGRSIVAHTRYIPGQPVPWPMPQPISNSNPRESAAAKAPPKGVF